MTPTVAAALALREHLARGGSIAPGLPPAPFPALPTPSIVTPGLASPHALISAHHRQHFAAGGAIPPHILAALALRPHFEDGGDAGGGDSSRSGGSGTSGGGDSSSSSSSSSGSAGGVGGFGGGSNDGYGGGSSSSSSSSSGGGGVGGFGGVSGNDGYGGGSSSSSTSSSSSSGSAGGVGGFGGSSSGDGYGGGSSSTSTSSSGSSSSSVSSTQSGGGFSSGAASGGDSGGDGGSVGSGSSAVGSIGGSYGAPAAGGFSSEGAPATGGFGNFGATPSATTSSGLTGVSPSASMTSGQTAAQSAAGEAANSAGEAGEDGTAGLSSGPSTGQAFSSFGPAPSSPYGSLANAQSTFGAAPDGTTGTVPGSVAASNVGALSGLSPSATQFGMMGVSGVDPSQVSVPSGVAGLGTYGLSTDKAPGFDNFNSDGQVTQSSLGADGYTGGFGYGVQTGINGNLNGPEGYVGGSEGVPAGVAGALAAGPVTAAPAEHGYSPEAIGGMFGDIGNVFGGLVSTPAAPSPYGTLSATPMGPLHVGPLSTAMAGPTSATPGVNADGDPVSVGGTSALTIHGDLSPSAQAMSDGVPATSYGEGLTVPNATAGGFAQRMGAALALGQNAGVPSFSSLATNPETSPVPTSMTGATTFAGAPLGNISDQEAFNARQNIVNGVGTDQDRAVVAGYLAQQNGTPSPGGTPDASQPPSLTITAATPVSPATLGEYTNRMQQFESGMNPGAVSPTGAVGLSQFTQGTWAGVARNNPDLGLPATPAQATPEQYSAATNALTNENVTAAVSAGLSPTFGTVYGFHVMGAPVAARALSSPDDTPIGQAGIPASTIAANPAVFGGVQTVGDLKGKLDSIMGGAPATASAPDALSTVGNFGVDQIAASVPTLPGKYGTVVAHDYSTVGLPSQGFRQASTTAHDAPGVTAFGGMAASYANTDGSVSNENMGTPSSMQGYTDFDGAPVSFSAPPTPDTSTSQPDTSTTSKHLSVPNFAGNAIGGMAASAVLGGPLGLGVGAANAVSGLLGGPTMADGINAVLAHPGAPSSVTGSPTSASNSPVSVDGATGQQLAPAPGSYGTSGPAGADTSSAPSSGVNPLDPHATAAAAYEAALAGMGQPGSATASPGSATSDGLSGYRHALWIRGAGRHALNAAPPTPVYNPMQDPSVLHALGLAG